MRSRAVLLVAVVGALLVGGATTGTTLATWRDQAAAGSGTVQSGSMALTAATAPTGLGVARGTTGTTLITISDASSARAKNLVQRLTPAVTGTLPNGVTATLTTRSGSTCTSTPQGAVATGPDGSFVTCLNVSVTSGAGASSATVDVAVAGRQLRGGSPAGWTATAQTVSVPVTITGGTPAPPGPVLSCAAASGTTLTWTATGTTYDVHESSTVTTWPPSPLVHGTSATTYTIGTGAWPQNETRYYRVVARNSGGPSSPSNVVKVSRNGNSANFTCGAP